MHAALVLVDAPVVVLRILTPPPGQGCVDTAQVVLPCGGVSHCRCWGLGTREAEAWANWGGGWLAGWGFRLGVDSVLARPRKIHTVARRIRPVDSPALVLHQCYCGAFFAHSLSLLFCHCPHPLPSLGSDDDTSALGGRGDTRSERARAKDDQWTRDLHGLCRGHRSDPHQGSRLCQRQGHSTICL